MFEPLVVRMVMCWRKDAFTTELVVTCRGVVRSVRNPCLVVFRNSIQALS